MTVVRLPAALREYAGGASAVDCDGATVGEVLAALERQHPGVGRRVLDEQGHLRRHVHVFLGSDRTISPSDPVIAGLELTILPAVSGGCLFNLG